jgi:hypothetical protein
MIELTEAALLFRGWMGDPPRTVRIIFRGLEVDLKVPRSRVFGAQADSVAFECDTGAVFEFFVRGCIADFSDAPEGEDEIESVIAFKRTGFTLVVMLLRI